ncbi:MAG: ATP-binding protein, partial [Candidatus Avelusimicrobium sp.]
FLSRVQEQRIGTTGRIYLVDQNGSVYAGEYQYRPEFDAEELRRAFTSGDRLIKALKTKQDDYVGAYASTPILGAYVAVLQLKSEAYRSIYYTNIILALFLLTIATLAYFGALTFVERLGEPIGALSEAAKEVSKGNLEGKIDEDIGWGEFKQLISQFNKMTADLKDYQVLQLQAQISEMKEHVFRAVAHDLRAPLLGLQGYLYILQSGKASKAEEKEYLEQMTGAARDLSSLLEDVLDVSRVQAGMLSPRKEPVDAAALAKSVTDALAPTAAEKGLLLETDVPPLTLEADAKLLRRVLMNLVSNAVKFTDKGYVRVCGGQDAAGDWLAVEDSGIGMSEQEMKGLFQKYYQINSDKAGYGLGLFISRQIVTAHGGELQVTSRRGKGSRFTVTFPKEKK